MSIAPEILSRLIALELPPEKFAAVLAILADSHTPQPALKPEMTSRQKANRRYYLKCKDAKKSELEPKKDLNSDLKRGSPSPPMILTLPPTPPPQIQPSLRSGSSSAEIEPFELVAFPIDKKPKPARPAAEADRIVDAFVAGYDQLAIAVGLARCRAITDKRRAHILARARDVVSALDFASADEGFRELFETVRRSPFLCGGSRDRPWKCDLDWLINESNFLKVLEGKYEKNQSPAGHNFAHAR